MSTTTIEDLPTEIKLRILQIVTWTSKHSPQSLISLASSNRDFFSIYVANKRFLQIESCGPYLPEALYMALWKPVFEASDFVDVESDAVWTEMEKVLPKKELTLIPSRLTAEEVSNAARLHRKICALLWDAHLGPESFCFYNDTSNCWQNHRHEPDREEHLLSCIYGFYASSESAMDRLCAIKHRSASDIDYFWHSFFSCYMIWVEPQIMEKLAMCHDALAELQGKDIVLDDESFEAAMNFLASVIIRYGPSIVHDIIMGGKQSLLDALLWVGSLKTRLDGLDVSDDIHEKMKEICEVFSLIGKEGVPHFVRRR